MRITKLGHCCMVIEEGGLKIMTDPGVFTVGQHELMEGLNVILFTHEHGDHYHLESLKKILEKNPNVRIITNSAVGKLLDEAGIKHEILEHGGQLTLAAPSLHSSDEGISPMGGEGAQAGVVLEGFGNEHAEIYDEVIPRVQNTGYMISGKFFFPGDALYVPEKPVEILALPVAGPWLKIKESIDYAKAIKPKKCFPVHDGMIVKSGNFASAVAQRVLSAVDIELVVPEDNKAMEF